MNLKRAGRLLILTAASPLVLDGWVTGCRGRGAAVPVHRAEAAPAVASTLRPPLDAADLPAYARGRTREVGLMREALGRLGRAGQDTASRHAALRSAEPATLERAGAAAAGLPLERYRDLVTRMDSMLRMRVREARSANGPEVPGSAGRGVSQGEWRLLDSLRVELAVLRSRFAAAAGEEGLLTP